MTKAKVIEVLTELRETIEPANVSWETEDYFAELNYDDKADEVRLALLIAGMAIAGIEDCPFFDLSLPVEKGTRIIFNV